MRPYQPGQDFYNLIETAVPEVIRAEYPMLVDFLKLFLTYLEQERTFEEKTINSEYGSLANNQVLTTVAPGGVSYEMRKFLEYRDISTTIDDFVPYFLQMFAKNWPQHTYISPDQFVSTLRYLYTHKSLEDTVQWFFRALFNEQAALYYPRVDILKASDGSWYVETSIKVGAPTNGFLNEDVAKYYIGQIIRSATGQAQVDRVRTTVVGQSFGAHLFVNELLLIPETIVGSFAAGQDVFNTNSGPEVHTSIIPVIVGVNILEGGAAYVVGDLVTFSEGPGLGEGFGAAGIVSSVGSAPLNGVTINNGGDGFVIGDPVVFISSSGSGADAFVDQVIAGNFLLEAEDGFLLGEARITGDVQYLAQEDHNFIPQDLSIEAFVNSALQLGAVDYTLANQPTWNIDTILDYVFAAIGSIPFMHPWCFRDFSGNTANVTLANTMLVANMTSLGAFANNDGNIFVIASPTDISTNAVSASVSGYVILSDITTGLNRNRLFVANTSLGFAIGQTVKFEGSNKLGIGTLSCNTASANVTGFSTSFRGELTVNTHIKVGSHQYAVRSITNNTFLTLYTLPVANATNSAFDVVPTGTLLSVTDQSQRIYGKIRHIAFVSPGSGYLAPPLVTVNSISALAQAVYYYDSGANTFNQSNGTVDVFRSANLTAQQSAGQITRISMTDSGVYYTDANAVVVTALHSQNVPEARFATLTANIGLGSLTSKSGSFRDTSGFLSADKFLQDGDYYNDHTYVVRVAESFDRWESFYKKILHPAGFKVLGEFVLSVQADADSILILPDAEDALVDVEESEEPPEIPLTGTYQIFTTGQTDVTVEPNTEVIVPIAFSTMISLNGANAISISTLPNNFSVSTALAQINNVGPGPHNGYARYWYATWNGPESSIIRNSYFTLGYTGSPTAPALAASNLSIRIDGSDSGAFFPASGESGPSCYIYGDYVISDELPVVNAKVALFAGNGQILTSQDSGATWAVTPYTDASPGTPINPATFHDGAGLGEGGLNQIFTQTAYYNNACWYPVDDDAGTLGLRIFANVGGVFTSTFVFDFASLGIYVSGSPSPITEFYNMVSDGTNLYVACEATVGNRIYIVKIPLATPASATLWSATGLPLASITNGSVDADYTNLDAGGFPVTGPLVLWGSKLVMPHADGSSVSGIIWKDTAASGAWTYETPWPSHWPMAMSALGGDSTRLWAVVQDGTGSSNTNSLYSRDTANTWTKMQSYSRTTYDAGTPIPVWADDGKLLLLVINGDTDGFRHWMLSTDNGATFTDIGPTWDTWNDPNYTYKYAATPMSDNQILLAEAVGINYLGNLTSEFKLSLLDLVAGTVVDITLPSDVIVYPTYEVWSRSYTPIFGVYEPSA